MTTDKLMAINPGGTFLHAVVARRPMRTKSPGADDGYQGAGCLPACRDCRASHKIKPATRRSTPRSTASL